MSVFLGALTEVKEFNERRWIFASEIGSLQHTERFVSQPSVEGKYNPFYPNPYVYAKVAQLCKKEEGNCLKIACLAVITQ